MERRYVTLLPATLPIPLRAYDFTHDLCKDKLESKRSAIATACESCRLKKAKCDGRRPVCLRCINQRSECNYATKEGETRTLALKRKYSALKEEATQLRELYEILHSKPQQEALEIFLRIRAQGDPLAVLELVKAAERLLPSSPPDTHKTRPEKLDVKDHKSGQIQVTVESISPTPD